MNILLFLPGIAEASTQEQITRRSKHVIVNDLAVHSMKYIKYFILRMSSNKAHSPARTLQRLRSTL